jgi:hypothetical protein
MNTTVKLIVHFMNARLARRDGQIEKLRDAIHAVEKQVCRCVRQSASAFSGRSADGDPSRMQVSAEIR